jgi:autoinducer 2 (AI-2) kinase
MAEKCVLAIDAGSGGGRALIMDVRGNLVSSACEGWTYEVPDDAGPMGKEFDAGEFWGIIGRLVKEAIRKAGVDPADIVAVSAASQRQGVVFLDRDGDELFAGPNVDIRAIIEGFTIDGECGDEVHRITGHAPSLIFTPAKLKWFQANRPDVYGRIDTVLAIADWIVYRLSGERVGEVSCASDLGLMDICTVEWSGHLMERLDLPQGVCPIIATAGTVAGTVTAAAAEQTGLLPGTPVVAGGGDTQCGLLGMGVKDHGQVGIVAGWSAVLQMVTAEPIIDVSGKIWSTCHALPGKWILESNAQETGGAYRWLRGLLFDESTADEDVYTLMDDLARGVAPGAEGVLAFIGPTWMDMKRLKPSVGGLLFPVTPTVTSVEKKHLVRAAIENICFAFKANYAQLESVSGQKVSDVSVGGGLAQSRVLTQMLADVLGMPVSSYGVHHVTSWGTAMCAAVGAGVYNDLDEAMSAMRPVSRVVEPDAEISPLYVDCYDKWLSTAKLLDEM